MPGPYHRLESPTQTIQVALQQMKSREIWGRAHRQNGAFPCVKAYPGELPESKRGIQFIADIPHDPRFSSPFESRWYHPHTSGVLSRTINEDDFAVIEDLTSLSLASTPLALSVMPWRRWRNLMLRCGQQ